MRAPASVLRALDLVSYTTVCESCWHTVAVVYDEPADVIAILHADPACRFITSPAMAGAVALADFVVAELCRLGAGIPEYCEPPVVHAGVA